MPEDDQRSTRRQCLILSNGNAETINEMLASLSLYWEPVQRTVRPDGTVYLLLWPRQPSKGIASRTALSSVRERFVLSVLRESFTRAFGN
jgi:hypothetical protein